MDRFGIQLPLQGPRCGNQLACHATSWCSCFFLRVSGGGVGKCFQPGEYFSLQESVDEATSRYYWWPGDNMPTPVMAKITFMPEGRRFLTENNFRSAGSIEIQHFCTLSNSRVRILRGSDCEIHECGSADPGWERDP